MVLQVALGILQDVRATYPGQRGVERDIARLPILVRDRGEGLFLHDLPNLDSLLLEGLETGRLSPRGSLSACSKGCRVPRFLSGLWLRIFDKFGCLLEKPDPNAIFFLRSIAVLGKKLRGSCSQKRVMETINEYRRTDQALRSPTLAWDLDRLECPEFGHAIHFRDGMADTPLPLLREVTSLNAKSANAVDWALLDRLQSICDSVAVMIGPFYANGFAAKRLMDPRPGLGFRHGPGATAAAGKDKDKYLFPNWSSKLRTAFSPKNFGVGVSGVGTVRNHELPSRLIAVEKDAKKPRLIAAEPVEHQWCQQAILAFLSSRIGETALRHFIDFRDQSTSQIMARRGSSTRELATVDLSSASDRLSCWSVERMLRVNTSLLRALHASRTRWIKTAEGGNTFFRLKKFASQGAATTFPIQSLFFLCVAFAACGIDDISESWKLRGKVRVFGDDIIVPRDRYEVLRQLLEYLELKVNDQKSFHLGAFRESCGGDYWDGCDVTPVKVRQLDSTTAEGRQGLLDTANLFFTKGLWHASRAVQNILSEKVSLRRIPIVQVSSVDPGYFSFVGSDFTHLRSRWNRRIHRTEFMAYGVRSRPVRQPRDQVSRLRKFFLDLPKGHPDYCPDNLLRPKVSDGSRWVTFSSITPQVEAVRRMAG